MVMVRQSIRRVVLAGICAVMVITAVPGGSLAAKGPVAEGMDAQLEVVVSTASSWAQDDIKEAVSLNLAGSEVLGDFQQPINRMHIAGLMVKLYEKLTGQAAPEATSNPFKDTDDPQVLQAYELSMIQGKSADAFAPYDNANRQQISLILWRFLHLQGLVGLVPVKSYTPFADSEEIAAWAAEAVDYNAAIGLLKGRSNNRFAPVSEMTREEAIVLIKRVYDTFEAFQ